MTLWNAKKEEEENIIKRKLLYDGHGTGDDRRLLTLIKAVTKFCLVKEPIEDIDKSEAQINSLISQSITAAGRIERMLEVYRTDLAAACTILEAEETEINNARNDIEKARLDLEYEAKIKLVNALPSCNVTEDKMKTLQEKCQILKEHTIKHQLQLNKISKICDEFESILKEESEELMDDL